MYQSISGFPEFSPQEQMAWDSILAIIRNEYEKTGAVPIETPVVERLKTLKGKASDDKEIYALRRLAARDGEDGAVDLALRFDLTVPMARYIGEHSHDLCFPFRRYQIQPVWRGERPQKGRYRQFLQCDIDIVGDGALSLLNDAEMPAIIYRLFQKLKFGDFTIFINNRKILTGLLASLKIPEENITRAIKIIDALEKVGTEKTKKDFREIGITDEAIEQLIVFFSMNSETDETLNFLEKQSLNAEYEAGVEELKTVIGYMRSLGVPKNFFRINLGIARGLDYYTGTVYETRLHAFPNIGSICSGGRYDGLLQKLGAKHPLPGVGISIGLSRIFPLLLEAGVINLPPLTSALVLITTLDPAQIQKYLTLGAKLRAEGINTEIYSERKKLGAQLKYAGKKGFVFAVIAGEKEFAQKSLILRSLHESSEKIVLESNLVHEIRDTLSSMI